MMKKYILLALAAMPFALYAEGEGGGKKFKMDLTDEQKTCLEEQGCPKFGFKKGEKGEKPEGADEARECMKKAFEACGIERPERPERPEGKKFKHKDKAEE
jgi:hypothetical protein